MGDRDIDDVRQASRVRLDPLFGREQSQQPDPCGGEPFDLGLRRQRVPYVDGADGAVSRSLTGLAHLVVAGAGVEQPATQGTQQPAPDPLSRVLFGSRIERGVESPAR